MKGNRVEATSNQMYPLKTVLDSSIRKATADVGVLATNDQQSASVLVWNYHDEDKKGTVDSVLVTFKGLIKKQVVVTQYRIDDLHSNSYEAWKKMGSPQQPTAAQILTLSKSNELKTLEKPVKYNTASGPFKFLLPRQGVSLLSIK